MGGRARKNVALRWEDFVRENSVHQSHVMHVVLKQRSLSALFGSAVSRLIQIPRILVCKSGMLLQKAGEEALWEVCFRVGATHFYVFLWI